MGWRLLSIAVLPTQNTAGPCSPLCFIWGTENSTQDQVSKGPFIMPAVLSKRAEAAGVRLLPNLIAQTPPVHIERQVLPKGDCPLCLQAEGFVWCFFLEEHFLQQTFHPNNSANQIATDKSQPQPQHTSAVTNASNIHEATERDGRAEVCEGREMFAVVNAQCLISCLSQRGWLSLGS